MAKTAMTYQKTNFKILTVLKLTPSSKWSGSAKFAVVSDEIENENSLYGESLRLLMRARAE